LYALRWICEEEKAGKKWWRKAAAASEMLQTGRPARVEWIG
jgi:hypothetical protein